MLRGTDVMETRLRPLMGFTGILVAIAMFVGVAALLGGPVVGDSSATLYSTWAIEHGQFACAYAPFTHLAQIPQIARPGATITPFYPLVSGAIAALVGLGHQYPFAPASLGHDCSHAYLSIFHWSVSSGVAVRTLQIGYIAGVVLLIGADFLLRASGRGRRLVEPVALVVIATLAPVLAALVQYFHPQDLMAMGLALSGVAAVLRERWLLAGVLIGLAVVTQQYTLLILAAVFFAVPKRGRWRFSIAVVVAVACIDVPFLVASSGRALRAIANGSAPSFGGTVLWELHVPAIPLFIVARLVPIAVAAALGWYVARRSGNRTLDPVTMVSLIGTAVGVRLVFEVNLWGYYFMALAVTLVLLEAIRGHVRAHVVGWILALTMAFDPIPGLFQSNVHVADIYAQLDLAKVVVGAAALYVLVSLVRRRVNWFWVGWVIVCAVAFVHVPGIDFLQHHPWPRWLWQVLLVPSGLALVAQPLVAAMHASRERTALADEPVPETPVVS